MTQWLWLHASSAGDTGSIPAQGTEIPHPLWCSRRERKWMNMNMAISLVPQGLHGYARSVFKPALLGHFLPLGFLSYVIWSFFWSPGCINRSFQIYHPAPPSYISCQCTAWKAYDCAIRFSVSPNTSSMICSTQEQWSYRGEEQGTEVGKKFSFHYSPYYTIWKKK